MVFIFKTHFTPSYVLHMGILRTGFVPSEGLSVGYNSTFPIFIFQIFLLYPNALWVFPFNTSFWAFNIASGDCNSWFLIFFQYFLYPSALWVSSFQTGFRALLEVLSGGFKTPCLEMLSNPIAKMFYRYVAAQMITSSSERELFQIMKYLCIVAPSMQWCCKKFENPDSRVLSRIGWTIQHRWITKCWWPYIWDKEWRWS